ncbi:unnamed protein product [Brassicogethes aeneus]|uniref:Uncharacterized protein n=1 Tax=Brassicogethes aeneus TaxID=1431903 RepID=A0A9P0BDI8_BRAAE|nr:unnamed protein product [Brassicogethes aeneus]
MLYRCKNCPGSEALEQLMLDIFSKNDLETDDNIAYKQWVRNGKSKLVNMTSTNEDFVKELSKAAVPKLPCKPGDSATSAVYETLLTCGLDDQIKCKSFDTTATNNGPRNGACILLEQNMKKDMWWLACRHHVMEIMLEAVLLQALGPLTSPEILIFKVSLKIKKKMVDALKNIGIDQSPMKRITLDDNVIQNKSLEDFVFSKTLRILSITGIPSTFLEKNVEVWEEDDDYKLHNKLHTTNKEQKQYLLLLHG